MAGELIADNPGAAESGASATDDGSLAVAWADACRAIAMPDHHHALDDLIRRYQEPHRRYHDLTHLGEVVAATVELAELEGLDRVERAVAVFGAFFHDAVYEPGQPDNEFQSGELARDVLLEGGMPRHLIDRVARAVNATAAHRAETAEEKVVVDADLAILAADAFSYELYRQGVRDEHGYVADEAWAAARRHVIEGFLARPAIYHTHSQRTRREAQARANLQAELAELR